MSKPIDIAVAGKCSIPFSSHETKTVQRAPLRLFSGVGEASQGRRSRRGIRAEQLKRPPSSTGATIFLRSEDEILYPWHVIKNLPSLRPRERRGFAWFPAQPLHKQRKGVRARVAQQAASLVGPFAGSFELHLIGRLKITLETARRATLLELRPQKCAGEDHDGHCARIFPTLLCGHTSNADMRTGA